MALPVQHTHTRHNPRTKRYSTPHHTTHTPYCTLAAVLAVLTTPTVSSQPAAYHHAHVVHQLIRPHLHTSHLPDQRTSHTVSRFASPVSSLAATHATRPRPPASLASPLAPSSASLQHPFTSSLLPRSSSLPFSSLPPCCPSCCKLQVSTAPSPLRSSALSASPPPSSLPVSHAATLITTSDDAVSTAGVRLALVCIVLVPLLFVLRLSLAVPRSTGLPAACLYCCVATP